MKYGSLSSPADLDKLFFVFDSGADSGNAVIREVSVSEILGVSSGISDFERGSFYYAYSDDGVSYRCYSSDKTKDGHTASGTPCQTISVNGSMPHRQDTVTAHYYKIVRFIDLRSLDGNTEYDVKPCTLLYSVTFSDGR